MYVSCVIYVKQEDVYRIHETREQLESLIIQTDDYASNLLELQSESDLLILRGQVTKNAVCAVRKLIGDQQYLELRVIRDPQKLQDYFELEGKHLKQFL